MTAKQPLPLYLIVAAFLVAIGMVTLSCQLLRQSSAVPRSLGELTERLSQSKLPLHVVPVIDNEPESGIYICKRRESREHLFRLLRGPEVSCKSKWQDVVYCENVGNLIVEEQVLEGWGDHGMQIGSLLFFGDPALLHGIHTVIAEAQVS